LKERQEREEEERKRRLQLYVFVTRCVAYPFNAKQPTDMTKRQLKVTKQQLESLQQRFQVPIICFLRFHFHIHLMASCEPTSLSFFYN